MLVKVKPGVYLNTDHIASIVLLNNGEARIDIRDGGGDNWIIPPVAVAHLLSLIEADSSAILPGEEQFTDSSFQFSKRPLTSRIAELLRDEYPQGATLEDLTEKLGEHYNKVYSAISDLLAERVAVFDPLEPLRYYHAQHCPGKPTSETEIDLPAYPDLIKPPTPRAEIPLAPIAASVTYSWRCSECHKDLGMPVSSLYNPGDMVPYICSCGAMLSIILPINSNPDPLTVNAKSE